MILAFTVMGAPQQKGSMRSFGYVARDEQGAVRTKTNGRGEVVPVVRASTTADNPKTKAWEKQVAAEALAAMANHRPSRIARIEQGPVVLSVEFFLNRPKDRKMGEPHETRPDLDKLVRAVSDALIGVAYADDGQVCSIRAKKIYASDAAGPRATIVVYPYGEMI